jgi:hypothetical protein
MDLLFPLPARVSKITPGIASNTAASGSVFSGALRTLARSGDRFTFDIAVSGATDREAFPLRAALRRLSSALRGQTNRLWFADPSYKPRGSFPTVELLGNPNFVLGPVGWTTSNASLTVADAYARVQNSGSAAGYIVNVGAAATISGAAYVARALTYPGSQSAWKVNCGATAGDAGLLTSGALTGQRLYWGALTAGGTSVYVSLLCNTATANDFVHYLYVSLSRCALVNGGSQTGPNLNIQALPASTSGLLLPGDRVQIGTQINTVDAPLNSNGSGLGLLQCTLPWRVSPVNGAPVIIFNPMARCILTNSSGTWDESPGRIADFEFQIQESLDLNL